MLKHEFQLDKDILKDARERMGNVGAEKPTSPAREESSALFLQGEMQAIIKTEIGMHDDFAAMVAAAVVAGLRKRAGGQTIYIPIPTDFKTRDAQIRAEFNGTNRAQVCKTYNISRSRLYQIVGG